MKGTTYKRILPSGHVTWELQLDAGRDENGKRLRIVRGGFKREKDADTELTRLLTEKTEGLLIKPDPKTFGEFMAEWLQEHAEKHCEPKTAERYRQLAAYVLPHLGATPLRDLSPLLLERVYNRLKEAGGQTKRRLKKNEKRQPAPLSARTVKHIADLVRGALNTAIRWKLLKVNPAAGCDLPKVPKKEAQALDTPQTGWLFDAARGHWLYPILLMDAASGCRRGEILALTWNDLTLEATPGVVKISKSLEQTKTGLRIKPPKNGKPRTLPLPAVLVEGLKEHQARQNEFRKQFGPDYRADLNLVFATPEGNYLKPDTVTSAACLLARKCGLKGIGLHSLRHSHGSQLIAAGVPLTTVSKRLGHSSVYVTASVYSHSFTQDEAAAAETWDATMRTAIEGQHARQ